MNGQAAFGLRMSRSFDSSEPGGALHKILADSRVGPDVRAESAGVIAVPEQDFVSPVFVEGEVVPRARVLLADDNTLILDHVRKMLEKDEEFEIVAAVTDADAALRESSRLTPDVIVLDISLGETSGIDVAAQLRDSGCVAKIVFLTVHEDADFLHAAMGAGGSAYVVKSRVSTDLISAIHAALSSKLFVSPSLLH